VSLLQHYLHLALQHGGRNSVGSERGETGAVGGEGGGGLGGASVDLGGDRSGGGGGGVSRSVGGFAGGGGAALDVRLEVRSGEAGLGSLDLVGDDLAPLLSGLLLNAPALQVFFFFWLPIA
jgi:hypothetical protein